MEVTRRGTDRDLGLLVCLAAPCLVLGEKPGGGLGDAPTLGFGVVG